jgi:tetratricopeptide (TPR) repeat protein
MGTRAAVLGAAGRARGEASRGQGGRRLGRAPEHGAGEGGWNRARPVYLFCVFWLVAHLASAPFSVAQGNSTETPSAPADLGQKWHLEFAPSVFLPVGQDGSYFGIGGGGQVEAGYRFTQLPVLGLSAQVGYDFVPTMFGTSLSLLSAGLKAEAIFQIRPRFTVTSFVAGGWYYSYLNSGAGPKSNNPYIQPGVGVGFLLSPFIHLGAECSYLNSFGLINGFSFRGTTTILLGGRRGSPSLQAPEPKPLEDAAKAPILQVRNTSFAAVFPVFFKYYDDHPIGHADIRNNASLPIQDITVSFFIKQYMDSPRSCHAPSQLNPGEQRPLELNALLTDKVLEVTEQTKVTAEVSVSYQIASEKHTDLYVETIRVNDRNALTWDDNRKVAAFVTEKDPTVLRFSKNVASMIEGVENRQISANLQTAMAIHLALGEYGMTYAADPSTPYAEFSKRSGDVDYVQFPNQTLTYKAGDCDDLSVLFCALLQSRGIDTAFITVPGHIFAAFCLGMKPEEARKSFLRADELIFTGDDTWIPVETTDFKGGFLKAWETGLEEWREHDSKKDAEFLPVKDAWAVFAPTGFTGERVDMVPPKAEKVEAAFSRELETFINRQIYSRVAELTEEIARTNNDPRAINKLALLYASYGLLDKAERELLRIVEKVPYLPAVMNLGNISYLRKDMKKALEYYRSAYSQDPSNPRIILALARVSHAIENYADADELYGRLRVLDPDLANRFVYLQQKGEEATRAAAVARLDEAVLWEE